MRIRFTSVIAILLLVCATVGWARRPATQAATEGSHSGLDLLRPMVGAEYRIDAKWLDGTPLTARAVWSWAVPDAFLDCKTFIPINGGEYLRFDNLFGATSGGLMNYDFVYDGSFKTIGMIVDGQSLRAEWSADGSKLRQVITIAADGSKYGWNVSMKSSDAAEWQPLIDGEWIRQATIKPFRLLKTPATQPTSESSMLDPVIALLGKWSLATKTADGQSLDATANFEWGVGRRFVSVVSTVSQDGGPSLPAYTVYGVVDGRLDAMHFGHDGKFEVDHQAIDGKRMTSSRPAGADKLMQSVELLDDSSMRWKTWMAGDPSHPQIDAIWHR